ncbi:MAG TPA: ATP-binding protein [Flavisolibacter sp.]|jgi:SpoVK/Ycf46/Vps4 family AAA+-type ATPase
MEKLNDIKSYLTKPSLARAKGIDSRSRTGGYRVLFYGDNNMEKSLVVEQLSREHGKEVYRVDLSKIVSKYIGETEKNLQAVFDKADGRDVILLFDEADALFGKRTNIRDSHDKYANLEINYLLQKLEEYSGLVILSTNQKANIDAPFMRRFQTVLNFKNP